MRVSDGDGGRRWTAASWGGVGKVGFSNMGHPFLAEVVWKKVR